MRRLPARLCVALALVFCGASGVAAEPAAVPAGAPPIRVGIIGLDTSHVTAFTGVLNRQDAAAEVAGARVVAAYPQGSRDIESSVTRVPGYTQKLREQGVEIVGSIAELLAKVDAVLLESNDGQVHLEQAIPVLAARKRMFIDKPMAATLADTIAICSLARHYQTPVFSSSALRYGKASQAVRAGSIGAVVGCDTFSPCEIEPHHADLFWYGIHGCEALFTVMGPGCETVVRTHTAGADLVTGVWKGGRIGTFRGLRAAKSGYGGMAFGTKGTAAVGDYSGYEPLVAAIVAFLRTGEPPVPEEETLDLYTFMEAADESKRRGGVPVATADVRATAEQAAREIVARHVAAAR